jgi:hypothetical protein
MPIHPDPTYLSKINPKAMKSAFKNALNFTLFVLLILLSVRLNAQQEANRWYFGVLAGLDFNGGAPQPLSSGVLNTNEGCAAICDAAGNFLFYTDGVTIWNKNHVPMPNGTGLLAGTSSTQAALIVPQPGSTTLYYVFTTDEIGGANGFRYSVVDMSLQSGNGDVVPNMKNILVLGNVTEKLTAVLQANETDYWIAVHEWGSDAFYVYPLTSAGLQAPVISNTGIIHSDSIIQNTYGQMKFSPCGNKLAAAIGYQDTIEVFDFDVASGVVSNPVTIPFQDHVYGVEFSQNAQKLYATTYQAAATLVQFDLSSGVPATIINSAVPLSTQPDLYALQMGPDGKIYLASSWSPYLAVINDPDQTGLAANFNLQGVLLDPSGNGITSALGLPGFVQSYFRILSTCETVGLASTNGRSGVNIFPNPFSSSFRIETQNELILKVNVTDAAGRNLIQSEENKTETADFGSGWTPGFYTINVVTDRGSYNLHVVKSE